MVFSKSEILKKYFGYLSFRQGQAAVIDNLADGRDVLCVMPTGAGKSICYQIPALMVDGITIVISPLISLMKDQVQSLRGKNINAAYINSSLSPRIIGKVYEKVRAGAYKIIYVAPERLTTYSFFNAVKNLKISFVVVDEAHCISKWGHDFRPSYLNITEFIKKLRVRPVIGAFTATATMCVKRDIIDMLSLNDPFIFISSFDRPNLYFEVRHPDDKNSELLSLLADKREKNGIVYCITRKIVDEVFDQLIEHGYSVTKYHAGLDDADRARNQEDFILDKKRIMVATNAFGMGINKGNVSFVIHYNMPKDMESYYQEAGRAGRDGNPAACVLLYSEEDIYTNKYLIESSDKRNINVRSEYQLLDKMVEYSTTEECLRAFILNYFGQAAPERCGNCSNCLLSNYQMADVTEQAKVVISCLFHLPKNYGKNMLVNILTGSKDKRIISARLFELPEYAKLVGMKRRDVENLVDKLIQSGAVIKTSGIYPVLMAGRELGKDEKITIRTQKSDNTKASKISVGEAVDGELFDKLKRLRYEIAKREGVPAYEVFSNAALSDMCLKMPVDSQAFLKVSGVGKRKCDKYADEFTAAIKKHTEEHGGKNGI